ncbi:large ribosomal subunit protein bL34c [Euphorbia lathyris]|uniref:large ribosomal subunit protein bL34c n=1 Tax=Euphorbia lathyris TaxID=212925 RepID=UPI003314160F
MAASFSIISSSPPPWISTRSVQTSCNPSASLSLSTGYRSRSNFSMNVTTNSTSRSGLLHCSFLSSSSLSFPSSFSGLSLGLDLNSNMGMRKERGSGLVVRAGKAALCQTRRNRSRKSLARTHGFRRRMRTTSGRAILKRRRAKGRKVLCPKSNPNSGKRA